MQQQKLLTPYEISRLMAGEQFDLLPTKEGHRVALLNLDGVFVAQYSATATSDRRRCNGLPRNSNCARSQMPF